MNGLWAKEEAPIRDVAKIEVSIDGAAFKNLKNGMQIPADAKTIGIRINENIGVDLAPLAERFRYKFDGVDKDWQRQFSDMGVVVRFLNKTGDLVSHNYFFANGDSPGWSGKLNESKLVRRREIVSVPGGADRMSMVISSAGGPAAIGVFGAENITVYRRLEGGTPERVFPRDESLQTSPDWLRDGTHASMATIEHLNSVAHSKVALCIEDDDPKAHAEWRFDPSAEIRVHAGETLIVEWEEMYSIGMAGAILVTYPCPPPGRYLFRANIVSAMGIPGKETSLAIVVFRPYWMQPLFWSSVALVLAILVGYGIRLTVRARFRRDLERLEQEHAISRERLRIARDLHDDLGARLTHISFLSGRAGGSQISLEESQKKLRKISLMTRDLVGALYETVWSVDPESDNVDALISYLTQMIENLCEPASIPCRIKISEFSVNFPVAGDVRHNVSLVVKEAVNNAIKHSDASELTARFEMAPDRLVISIEDNGKGFRPGTVEDGNGLKNMRHRMSAIHGVVTVKSGPSGEGTTVILDVPMARNGTPQNLT